MSKTYLTFRRFIDPHAAEDFIQFLNSEGIDHEVEDASPSVDVTFANNTLDKEVHIKLLQEDFQKVENLLLKKESDVSIEDIPEDYYLLDFSNEELIEILMKPDEWSSTDYNLAQKILKDRGKEVDAEFIETLRKKRNEELSAPEKSQKSWIYAGYIFALLGGLLGIFIGWHLLTFKKTLPDGSRAYGYVASDRKSGRNILIIALIFFTVEVIFWLMDNGL